MLLACGPLHVTAQEPDGCTQLPAHEVIRTTLQTTLAAGENGGFGHAMWIVLVDRDGVVCVVAFADAERGDQWPGGRAAAAAKANTANDFSLPERALSTANLYRSMLPGGSFYGLQQSNPIDVTVAYQGPVARYGQPDDPMIGTRIGGVVALGGGLPLYDADGRLVGGLGVSGDTSCADHIVAWKVRDQLALDYVPNGVSPTQDDNIVLDQNSPWSHPVCGLGEEVVFAALPSLYPIGNEEERAIPATSGTDIASTADLETLVPSPTPVSPPTLAPTATLVTTPILESTATVTPSPTLSSTPVVEATATPTPTLTPTPSASIDLAPTMTPSPTAASSPAPTESNTIVPAGFNPYRSVALGISLLYPDGWRVAGEQPGSGLIVESVESCIDIVERVDADCGVVLALTLDPGTLALDTSATSQLMQQVVEQFVGDAEIVAGPTLRRINDQDAAVAEFLFSDDDVSLPGLIALIVHDVAGEMRTILLIGAASLQTRDTHLPLVEAVINSVVIEQTYAAPQDGALPRPAPTISLRPTPMPTPTL